MYEFEKDLILGETILYKGKPVPGKVKKMYLDFYLLL